MKHISWWLFGQESPFIPPLNLSFICLKWVTDYKVVFLFLLKNSSIIISRWFSLWMYQCGYLCSFPFIIIDLISFLDILFVNHSCYSYKRPANFHHFLGPICSFMDSLTFSSAMFFRILYLLLTTWAFHLQWLHILL